MVKFKNAFFHRFSCFAIISFKISKNIDEKIFNEKITFSIVIFDTPYWYYRMTGEENIYKTE